MSRLLHQKWKLLAAISISALIAFGTWPIIPRNAEATTTVISTNQSLGTRIINAGDTLIIDTGAQATADYLTNHGTIIVRGILTQDSVSDHFENYGIIVVTDSPDVGSTLGDLIGDGKLTNYPQGLLIIDTGAALDISKLDNRGTINNYGEMHQNQMENVVGAGFNNYASFTLTTFGSVPSTGVLTNKGSIKNAVDAGMHIFNAASLKNDGGSVDNSGYISLSKYSGLENINGGIMTNNYGGTIDVHNTPSGGVVVYFNREGSTINNSGRFIVNTETGFANYGNFNNLAGSRVTTATGSGLFYNYGIFNNNAGATIDNQGYFYRECGDVFNNQGAFIGNAIVNNCSSFPIIHMQDTTATQGSVTYAGRQINAEYVNATSQLIGDKIDSITLRLQRIGSPPGTFQVGVFNANLTPKMSFEIRSTSTLSTTFQDYEFKLPNNELYTIQQGDRIGIKYNGGTTSNAISVMTDRNAADPFDGTKSNRVRYESSWITSFSEDMYMTLKQTHNGAAGAFPLTHMSDTTASFPSLVSAPRQLMTEYVTPNSQLVGDKIDSITIRLQKVGAPMGIAEIGVFNTNLSVKQLFGTIEVSTISTTATDYEFHLSGGALYSIASGDRIGIKYTGGSGSVGINVTPDRDTADPFDGTNSYRARYEASWISSTGEDMYMILKQTHG